MPPNGHRQTSAASQPRCERRGRTPAPGAHGDLVHATQPRRGRCRCVACPVMLARAAVRPDEYPLPGRRTAADCQRRCHPASGPDERPFVPARLRAADPAGDRRRPSSSPWGRSTTPSDLAAWSSSIAHIRSTPGYPDGSWPPRHGMSAEDNLADLTRHAADFEARRGLHVHRPRPDRRERRRLRLPLPVGGAGARRRRAVVGARRPGRAGRAARRRGRGVAGRRLAVGAPGPPRTLTAVRHPCRESGCCPGSCRGSRRGAPAG